MDIVFVLDTSTSVTEPNFIKILAFLKSFLSEAPIHTEGVRVGVLTYSSDVRIQFHLNEFESKREVLAAIDKIPYRYGSTNTAEALRTMNTVMFHGRNGDREDAPNMAFVVTDGVSNINSYKTIDAAEAAKKAGIHIYAIGIGLADTRELNKIASVPISQNRFIVREFDELDRLQTKLFEKICPGKSQFNGHSSKNEICQEDRHLHLHQMSLSSIFIWFTQLIPKNHILFMYASSLKRFLLRRHGSVQL